MILHSIYSSNISKYNLTEGVYNYNGITNISGTGITNNDYGIYNAGGTTNIKEGAEIQSNIGIYNANGRLNIGEQGTMNPDSPIITGETYGLTVTATGKVYMYDGQVKGKTGATEGYITYTEEGYVVANKTEGEYFVDYLALGGTANAVAQVNGVSYSTLQSAINSITGGEEQTITLLNGIIAEEIYEYNQKGIQRKNGKKYWLTKIEDNKKEGKEYILSMYEVLKDYSIYIKNRWIEEKI